MESEAPRSGRGVAWLDGILPEDLERRSGFQPVQVRVVVMGSFVMAAATAVALLSRLLVAPMHPVAIAAAGGAALAFAAAPFLLRLTGSVRLAGTVILTFLVTALWIISFFGGGLGAPILLFAPVIPFAAAFFFGAGSSRRTAAVLGAGVVLLFLANRLGLTVPMEAGASEMEMARVVLAVFSLFVTAALATLYERERTKSDARLRASEEMYRLLFEQSKDFVALSTPEGKLVDVNESGVELLGYPSREKLLETDVRELYADPGRRLALAELLAAEGFVKSWESELRTFTGESRIVQGTTTVIRDAAGGVAFYLAILRDVTEARFVERDREAALAALATRNDDLRQIHRAVGHDLKSPLFTLKGFLGMLGKDLADGHWEHARKDLATVTNVTDRIAGLVEELLDFSRVERRPEDWVEVDLASVVEEVLTLLEGRIRDAGAVVEVGELQRLRGDVALLRTIFQNLIENAVRFCTGGDEPRIEVGARHVGSETVFYVADNGAGIAPENQEKVFALFQTAGSERGGTGIGLATVKRAVEVHGGRIWVESEGGGKGATFFFTLPCSGPSSEVERQGRATL